MATATTPLALEIRGVSSSGSQRPDPSHTLDQLKKIASHRRVASRVCGCVLLPLSTLRYFCCCDRRSFWYDNGLQNKVTRALVSNCTRLRGNECCCDPRRDPIPPPETIQDLWCAVMDPCVCCICCSDHSDAQFLTAPERQRMGALTQATPRQSEYIQKDPAGNCWVSCCRECCEIRNDRFARPRIDHNVLQLH